MKLFKRKKNDDSRGAVPARNKYQAPPRRRSNRLLVLRLRKFGLVAGALALIGGIGFTGHHSGSFKKIHDRAVQETLARSAAAGFRVREILVTGRVHIPSEELLARFSIKENMPIFGVSIAEAQKSVMDIPWVKSVSISRRLPDKILVEMEERVPIALWQHRQKITLIDREGVVLTGHDLGVWRHLPLVVGEDAPQHVAQLIGLLQAEPALAAKLASAVRIERRRWDLRLANGISVKLPETDVELALRRLGLAEEQKNILGRDITGIDLRQPEKMFVTINQKTKI